MSVMGNMNSSSRLSHRQELLLMKYVDGECRVWERWIVQKLIRRSTEARQFLGSFGEIQKEVQERCESARCGCSVWPEVRARIAHEERSAVLLGERTVHAARRPAWFEFLNRPTSAWAATAVAACCVLVVSYQGLVPANDQSASSLASQSEARGPFAKQLVSAVSVPETSSTSQAVPYVAPRILEERIPSSVEVDWLRGNGRVRLIPDSQTHAPIIWVKRRNIPVLKRQLAATPAYGEFAR